LRPLAAREVRPDGELDVGERVDAILVVLVDAGTLTSTISENELTQLSRACWQASSLAASSTAGVRPQMKRVSDVVSTWAWTYAAWF
jgi:hypothetical protein